MVGLEKVICKDKTLAIIVRAKFKKEGAEFFTPPDYTQQLAYMNRPKGHVVKAHRHNPVKREILSTRETLFIKSGKLRADFYLEDEYIESRILNKGDVLLIVEGGHGFEFLENSELIEVKQGPYAGENDSVKFGQGSKITLRIKQ